MKIVLIQTGKTKDNRVQELADLYFNRLQKYVGFECLTVPDLKQTKNLKESAVKQKEGELILKYFQAGDHIVLLDEKGKDYSSEKFADHIQSAMNRGPKRIVFVIGGPYGFDPTVYAKAQEKLRLSSMTFSHQIIRAIFAEQLYRCFSILNNEPYHHS